jgi:hypothetical protein
MFGVHIHLHGFAWLGFGVFSFWGYPRHNKGGSKVQ